MNLGDKIKIAREALGLNQSDLAERIGVEPATVSRWETGAVRPRTKKIKKIAQMLERPVEWFQEPTVSVSEFDARLKVLEERAKIASIARSSAIPLLVQENWDKAGPTIQSIVCYLLSGESEYIENLAPDVKSPLGRLVPYVGRAPWRFSKGE